MVEGYECDDIILYPELINYDTSRADWLNENTPTDYGDSKLFRFDGSNEGIFVNNTNWAVGWNYTEVTCTIGEGCSAGASGLWEVLALVVVAGFLLYVVSAFFEGSVTLALIVLLTIVAMLIPYLIGILNGGC
jgi:hypothetical protein